MKRFVYPLMALFIGGIVVTGILLLQHYNPDLSLGIISCGSGFENPCLAASNSPYASFLGIPSAAWGMFFYLSMLFILLIADYAADFYYHAALAVMLPLTALAVLIDIFLAAMLIKLGTACTYCIATYGINVAALVVLYLWYRKEKDSFSFIESLKDSMASNSAPARAAVSSLFVAVVLLGFTVYLTNSLLETRNPGQEVPPQEVARFIDAFYQSPATDYSFPESGMIIGNDDAPVTMHVYTDYLCSACYKFYEVEKRLLALHGRDLKIIYYHFPLDQDCNDDMQRSVYPNSCVASRAMEAAVAQGTFVEYLLVHFKHYHEIHENGYSADKAKELAGSVKGFNISDFSSSLESRNENVQAHIEAAKTLGIQATPTLFIAGRKLEGVYPPELLSAIVQEELRRK